MNKVMRYLCFLNCVCLSFLQSDWQVPKYVGNASYESKPQIAVDPFGNAIAIWKDENSSNINTSSLPYGATTWDDQITHSSICYSGPKMAIDSFGNAIAVWHQGDGNIQALNKPYGGIWQAMPDNLHGNGVDPQIAFDSFGNATVVWRSSSGIEVSTKPYGGTWQSTPEIIPLSKGDFPQIAVDAAGNATVVWSQPNGNDVIVKAATKPYGGEWQSTPDSVSSDGLMAIFPQITVDLSGNVTVVWVTEYDCLIQTSTKPFGGSWQSTPDTLSVGGQEAKIAVAPSGDVTVVWSNNYVGTQASTKPFGGSWQPIPDNIPIAGIQSCYPQIAFDAVGNATALWLSYGEQNGFIQSATKFTSPAISSISPNIGPTAGGASVTISGNVFIDVTAVYFGTTPATNFTVISPTEITAVSPTGSHGSVDIIVETTAGTSSITTSDQYRYQDLPSITSVSPCVGPTEGGTPVTITGASFTDVTKVYFGSAKADFTVVSPTEITAIAPASSCGTVDIRVESIAGVSPIIAGDQYKYQKPPFVIDVFSKMRVAIFETYIKIKKEWLIDWTANSRSIDSANWSFDKEK